MNAQQIPLRKADSSLFKIKNISEKIICLESGMVGVGATGLATEHEMNVLIKGRYAELIKRTKLN